MLFRGECAPWTVNHIKIWMIGSYNLINLHIIAFKRNNLV